MEACALFCILLMQHDISLGHQIKSNSGLGWSDIVRHKALLGRSRLRGGGGKLQRHLSHHDIKPVFYGTPDTCDARVYAKNVNGGDYFSLWHDLPLFELSTTDGKPTGALNFVCEITKGTRKKFEIATSEPFNPIKQDEDQIEGRLRSFKKGDIYFNWGCFPR